MSVTIVFARGDSFEKGFLLKNKKTGQPITENYDEIYFTVKKYHTDHEYLFQKRMTTGGIQSDGDGHYTLFILPEDTNGLSFGKYDIDIELRKGELYKRTFSGTMELTKEVTHQNNE
jgi:hypothetical protein